MVRRSLAFALTLTSSLSAQALLTDVNTVPAVNPWSILYPSAAAEGSRVFFAAADRLHGEELFVTDGTAGGTALVDDIVPGSAPSSPRQMVGFAGGVAFTVGPLRALWHSDGTVGGTRLLTSAALGIEDPIVVGSRLYFAANGSGAGQELWSSDGTPAGTALVTDIRPGSGWSEPRQMVEWSGKVWFLASDGGGARLWSSDGTAAGTVEAGPGVAYGLPHALVATSAGLFLGTSGMSGGELWFSDGTAGGTALVRGGLGYPAGLTALGGIALFTADDGSIGVEPWRSDGTAAGTFPLGDLYPGGSSPAGGARSFTALGSVAYFSADDGTHGHELWATDGSVAGTRLVADVRPGADGSLPGSLRAIGNRLYFVADDGIMGPEPWITDGTASGTRRLRNIHPGPNAFPSPMVPLGNRVFFSADDGVHGREPWISDGTTPGTVLLADLDVGVGHAEPEHFTRFGRRFVFVADDGVHGREPWISDGTAAGTSMLADIAVGSAQSYARGFVSWGGRLWFNAYDASGESEPWVTDGTATGTVRFADLNPGPGDSRPHSFTPLDGRMVFGAIAGSGQEELWVTDGTVGGTLPLVLDPTITAQPRGLVRAGDRVFLVATDSLNGRELRVTDGTAAGTFLVADLVPGADSPQLTGLTALGDRVVFAASVSFNPFPTDIEPWVSDGTPGGTQRLADIVPGVGSSRPRSFVEWRDRVWFVVELTWLTSELWSTDGTPAGTARVAGPMGQPTELVAAGDRLFFRVGSELWTCDGTSAGTAPVGGGPFTALGGLAAAGDGTHVLFSATDALRGPEPWISDGTPAGTVRLADLWPGSDGSSPVDFTTIGRRVAFSADDDSYGREPFTIPLGAIGAALARPFGVPCRGTAGEPRIGARGAPRVGGSGFALTLASALPSVPAICAFGTDLAPGSELTACAPAITGSTVSVVLGTDSNGGITLPVPVPALPALVGAGLFAQFVVVDAQGGFLGVLAFSDLIDLVVGV